MKSKSRRMVLVPVAVLLAACGCAAGPAGPPGDESSEVIMSRVERIILYQDGEAILLDEIEGIPGILAETLVRLNLQARCVFSQGRVDRMKQEGRVVEMVFREAVDVTISQFIEPEERHHIATDENGYRVLEKVKLAIFILEDNLDEALDAHVLVGSEHEGGIGYGCWAVQQEGSQELDRDWIDELRKGIDR